MDDLLDSTMTPSSPSTNLITIASSNNTRVMPVREDCWSEEASSTLVDAWGRRYLELNRGNLRQKDWQDVAVIVNNEHGLTPKTRRTDVQCKNRVDTIKKKYKAEKARVTASNGAVSSSWLFYDRLDGLIGSNVNRKLPSPPLSTSPLVALPLTYRNSRASVPPTAVALPQKRSADDGFRRNYSAMAAAAAADAESDESEEEEDREIERGEESEEEGEGMSKLARAIQRFGEMYERVEGEKLRQMVELEKQRMQFTKEMELQRMKMLMDTQVQLEKIKRRKQSGSDEIYNN